MQAQAQQRDAGLAQVPRPGEPRAQAQSRALLPDESRVRALVLPPDVRPRDESVQAQ